MKKTLIEEVEEYVRGLLLSLPDYLTYHNLNHTLEVVSAIKTISDNNTFSKKEQEILLISAWFHDTGFIKTYKGHEKESTRLAIDFLKQHGYDKEDIKLVKRCITATKISYKPQDMMEMAIRDADVCHLAGHDYFNKLSLLKQEWEYVFKKKITDQMWFSQNLNFLTNHQFQTPYCKNNLSQKKQENMFKNLQKVACYKVHI